LCNRLVWFFFWRPQALHRFISSRNVFKIRKRILKKKTTKKNGVIIFIFS
jgi:hypothetical protein